IENGLCYCCAKLKVCAFISAPSQSRGPLAVSLNNATNKMNKEIISKIIGRLKQEESFPDWWKSEEVEIPFFDNDKLTITFMDFEPEHDKTFIDEADQALTNFLKLNANDRNLISELAYKNCMEFLDAVEYDEADEPLRQIKNKNEIWNFIQPTEIYITRRPYKEQD